MDGRNTGDDNSGEGSTSDAGKNGRAQNNEGSQAPNTHVTTSPHHIDRGINNNNNQSITDEHKSNNHQEQQVCAWEGTSCNRRGTQSANTMVSPIIEARTRISESKQQHGEDSINHQDNNMKNNTPTVSTDSTHGVSNFSFDMRGNSSQLTPNLNAGKSTTIHNKEVEERQTGDAKEQG